jgi:hypothetical protein
MTTAVLMAMSWIPTMLMRIDRGLMAGGNGVDSFNLMRVMYGRDAELTCDGSRVAGLAV